MTLQIRVSKSQGIDHKKMNFEPRDFACDIVKEGIKDMKVIESRI